MAGCGETASLGIQKVGNMANNPELSREEIFAYIEKELLTSRKVRENFPFRTKSNYLMAFLINGALLFFVLLGGVGVYLGFRAAEYQLVGKPESILGLEEALYQELQKKIAQELAQKEAELASTKARLEDLQAQMTSYREEAQKRFALELEKRQKELENRFRQSLQDASVSERQRLLAMYEQEKKKLADELQQEYAKREKEYQENLFREQQELTKRLSNQQITIETARKELSTMQTEYEVRLRALQQTNQQTISLLRSQLALREREDAFRLQVEAEFSAAMRFIREGKYDEAQRRLSQISEIYSKKPRDLEVSTTKQTLDIFFVEALQEYIRLKQGGIAQEIPSVSLAKLRTLSDALQKGTYDNNTNQLSTELKALAREIPEVFAFYSQYQDFLSRVQTEALQRELRQADSLYALKDYKAALLAYTAIAKRYPLSARREDVFQKMTEAITHWQQTVALRITNVSLSPVVTNQVIITNYAVVTNQSFRLSDGEKVVTNVITNEVRVLLKGDEREAAKLFTNALEIYKKNPKEALSHFVSVIEKQPMTSYLPLALRYIQQIYESTSSLRNEEQWKQQQEEQAKILYLQAEEMQQKGEYTQALQLYQQVILRYPLSSYIDKSLENLDKLYYRLLAGTKKAVEIEPYIKARVMFVEGEMLTLSLLKGQSLFSGQRVKLYRRRNNQEVEEIGKAEITRANQLIIQAKIQQTFSPVRPGDLVVGE